MTDLPHLTLIDSPVQLDGEIAPAWAWAADEIGCPILRPALPACPFPTNAGAEAGRKDRHHALQD